MNKYIFLSDEGYTYQPVKLEEIEADEIENSQVIGFSEGESPDDAYNRLLNDNPYIKDTSFNHIYCYRLDSEYERNREDFFIARKKINELKVKSIRRKP